MLVPRTSHLGAPMDNSPVEEIMKSMTAAMCALYHAYEKEEAGSYQRCLGLLAREETAEQM